jgi:predicted RNA-binding Zn-ribbon protein involved in translation (DUF1610 family)
MGHPLTGNEITAAKKAVENQEPYQRTDCPNCGDTLEKTKEGTLHCPFCGWVDFLLIRRPHLDE